jgi:NAD(P)H-dependent FMN reductase
MLNVLVLVGSNNPTSINRELAAYAASLMTAQVTLMDMQAFDDIPVYSPRRQQVEDFPPAIQDLFALIQRQDALLIASPEYNGTIPAAFKNVIDWLSRIQMAFLGQKPTLMLSTSPGANGGATNLEHMAGLAPRWGAQVTGTYSLGKFHDHFDANAKKLAEPEYQRLLDQVSQLERAAKASLLQAV